MNNLPQIFSYEGREVRTVVRDGEPWFVAKDVCEVLNLTNPTETLRALDADEKSTLRISEGGPEVNIINEPGLYSLVIRSNKPEAKQFKRWITHEVLPSIRKTSTYSIIKVEELSPELQLFNQMFQSIAQQQIQMKQLEGTVQAIKDTVITMPDNWREDINRMFNRIVEQVGGKKFQELRGDSYKALEQRARVNLKQRLSNLKDRMIEQGASKTALSKVNRLDIIEADPKLREIYTAIIKEYTIKFVS